MKKIIFMFSGQGSQYYQMGATLFEEDKIFRENMICLDRYVEKRIGKSVIESLYRANKKKGEEFSEYLISHIAIFMVEFSLGQSLIQQGIIPDYVLGYSMGEFAAAAMAGVMDVSEILECVIVQAECVGEYCPEGRMMSIMDNSIIYNKISILHEKSTLTAINYDKHFVISGDTCSLSEIQEYLELKKIPYQYLPVKFAFHSALIDNAKAKYISFLAKKKYESPSNMKYISCVEGKEKKEFEEDYFWNIARKCVRFQEGISHLDSIKQSIFVDLSPGGTLANFVRRCNIPNQYCYTILSLFGEKNINVISEEIRKEKGGNTIMQAYVFPGQGSQYKGMGKELFREFPEYIERADQILGYSIEQLCLEDKDGVLSRTLYTQPALYIVNALSYYKKIKEDGRLPDYVAGHSLGEYNALLASGVFDFDTGLKIVKFRAEVMDQQKSGGMAAIIGIDIAKIKNILARHNLNNLDIANLNTPFQTVISGPEQDLADAEEIFEKEGAKNYVMLKVSGSFHSRYMLDAKTKFEKYIDSFQFSVPRIPIISNINALPYKKNEIKFNMINQLTNSVRWSDTIRYLMSKDCNDITQIGPGMVLSNMINTIKKETTGIELNQIKELNAIELNEQEEVIVENKSLEEKLKGFCSQNLGCQEFKETYKLQYTYVAGGMYRAISSVDMVVRMAKAGMLGILGAGGLNIVETEHYIRQIKERLADQQIFGVNIVHNPSNPDKEEDIIDLFLREDVTLIEAAAYLSVTPAIVKFHAQGLKRIGDGTILSTRRVMAKISRPEIASLFLSPAPDMIISRLIAENKISNIQAELLREVPVADEVIVEADSGGHTDGAVAYALVPTIIRLRDDMQKKFAYKNKVRVGAAGGIGTPEAALASYMMGADFIVTGSINQCTVEAGTSEIVKTLLQEMNVQDTEYVPAGDMFELGAKVQVLKKGLFFPSRANKLYMLYNQYNSLEEIDQKTQKQLQEKYFKSSFENIFEKVKKHKSSSEIDRALNNPKYKMVLIFKWYFNNCTQLALKGVEEEKVDFQVPCGPALGAFNQWIKGSELENWTNRHVDKIAIELLNETAALFKDRFLENIKK